MHPAISRAALWLAAIGPATLLAQRTPGPSATPRITPQASNVTTLLQAAHAVDSNIVWASGHGGAVVRTRDGGRTWQPRPVPGGETLEFRDVHAVSADTAWIMSAGSGAKSRIYRTNDGGATWTLQFINQDTAAFYDCLTMFNAHRGIAYSDASSDANTTASGTTTGPLRTRILRTVDGGARWTLLDSAHVPPPLAGEGAFAASGRCVVHADSTHVFIATGAPGARLFRSRDGGAQWSAVETPFVRGPSAGLTGLSFLDANRGIAVAADIGQLRTDVSPNVVGLTDDGGRSWTMRTRPPLPGALAGVTHVPGAGADVAVAVGFGGAFYTMDGARTWIVISPDVFTGVTAAGRTAWITGANGRVIRLDW